ncbi:MAG TPA: Crp/Fnr family transcriptional regulator [Patescibacteria group bacterium]|nr:Crp/Fnr family transcriptional regulator [Patescibacteria group bacterium]
MMNDDIGQRVAKFFSHYPARSFKKRQLLVRAGETPPGVFYIVEGRVNQYDITPSGNEIAVNVFKPGAFFPMSTAINGTPNYYFFEAGTAVTTRQAPAVEVVRFLKDNPDILFDLLARVYRGTDGVLRRMAHLMGGNAKTRLLFELLNAAYRFGEPQPDGSIFIALTESDLARHSGLARETINRTIQALKTEELVTVTPHGLTIKSASRLEEILGNGV